MGVLDVIGTIKRNIIVEKVYRYSVVGVGAGQVARRIKGKSISFFLRLMVWIHIKFWIHKEETRAKPKSEIDFVSSFIGNRTMTYVTSQNYNIPKIVKNRNSIKTPTVAAITYKKSQTQNLKPALIHLAQISSLHLKKARLWLSLWIIWFLRVMVIEQINNIKFLFFNADDKCTA